MSLILLGGRWFFVAFVLLFVGGCATGADEVLPVPPIQSPETPAIEAPENFPPDSSVDDDLILGGWRCEEGPEQEIAFRKEDGARVFQSYLDGRPMSTGNWQWYGNTLSVEGTGGDYRFERVSRSGDQLTLEGGVERWVCALHAE